MVFFSYMCSGLGNAQGKDTTNNLNRQAIWKKCTMASSLAHKL